MRDGSCRRLPYPNVARTLDVSALRCPMTWVRTKLELERLESGEAATQLSGFLRVCRALGLLERIDLMLPEPTPGPMAQLKQQGHLRQRATGKKAAEEPPKKWTWGEPE